MYFFVLKKIILRIRLNACMLFKQDIHVSERFISLCKIVFLCGKK